MNNRQLVDKIIEEIKGKMQGRTYVCGEPRTRWDEVLVEEVERLRKLSEAYWAEIGRWRGYQDLGKPAAGELARSCDYTDAIRKELGEA